LFYLAGNFTGTKALSLGLFLQEFVITIQAWLHCVVVTAIIVKHVNLKLVWLKLWFALRENIQGVECMPTK
jgi:hypothetical protein